jgi:uncharacterized membrane protein HdeD (DUF308 family)
MALGIGLILLGVLCIAADVAATFATVFVFGWLLLIGGIIDLVHAFRFHTTSGFLGTLLSGLLRGLTGFLLLRYPGAGAVALTLVLASFFIVTGAFRATGSGVFRLPQWGWSMFSGIVSVVLGVILLAQLPASSLWFIGFAIGLDMILEGASLVAFSATLRRVPEFVEPQIRRAA